MPENLFNYLYPSNPTQALPAQASPAQVTSTFIHGDNVIYGLTYENDGNGNNKVKLLIKPLYLAKAYEWDTGFSISDEFKDQVSLALVKHSPETDKIAIIFPEEATNKQGKKYIKGLLFNTYEINLSINDPVVKPLSTTKLQKNIDSKSLANEDNSYFQPKVAVTKAGGKVEYGIVVTANNLNEKAAVAWYLKPNNKGEFKSLIGAGGTIERKLFKLNDPNSEFALNGNTLLHSQTNKKFVGNKIVEITDIFIFDIKDAVKNIKNGKGTNKNEYLLNQKDKIRLFSSENKISCLQYMAQSKRFAFLESNTLHIRSLNNIDAKLPIYEFQGSIEQLYIEENDQGNIIATAVSEGNIIVVRIDHSTEPKVTITPINAIQNLNDFLNIIHGQLPPNIASSTTVATTTLTPGTTTTAPTIATKQPTTPTTVATSKSTPDEITVVTKQSTTPGVTIQSTAATTKPTTTKKQSIPPTQAVTTAATNPTTEPTRYIIPTTVPISKITDNPNTAQELYTTSPYTMADRLTQASPLGIAGKSNNNGATALSTVGAIGVAGLLTFGIWIYNKHLRLRSRNAPSTSSRENIPLTAVVTDNQSNSLADVPSIPEDMALDGIVVENPNSKTTPSTSSWNKMQLTEVVADNQSAKTALSILYWDNTPPNGVVADNQSNSSEDVININRP